MKKLDAIDNVIVAMFPLSPVITMREITADLTKVGLSIREIHSRVKRLLSKHWLKRELRDGRYQYSVVYD